MTKLYKVPEDIPKKGIKEGDIIEYDDVSETFEKNGLPIKLDSSILKEDWEIHTVELPGVLDVVVDINDYGRRMKFQSMVRNWLDDKNGNWTPNFEDNIAKYFVAWNPESGLYCSNTVKEMHTTIWKYAKNKVIIEKLINSFDNKKLRIYWI